MRAHFNERWWFVNYNVPDDRLISYGIEKRILEKARQRFLPGYEEEIYHANLRIGLACLDMMNQDVKHIWYPAHVSFEHAQGGIVRHD